MANLDLMAKRQKVANTPLLPLPVGEGWGEGTTLSCVPAAARGHLRTVPDAPTKLSAIP